MIHAAPLDVHFQIFIESKDNIFEWHFTIHGTPNSVYEGRIYHGRILLPPEWPMKPPQILFMTVLSLGRLVRNRRMGALK